MLHSTNQNLLNPEAGEFIQYKQIKSIVNIFCFVFLSSLSEYSIGSQSEYCVANDDHIPAMKVLEERNAIIGSISINIQQIFDQKNKKESGLFYKSINYLHIKTKIKTIKNFLLFKKGDLFNNDLLKETERKLRQLSFIYNACIRITKYSSNKVSIEVITYDVWTLKLGFNYSQTGGNRKSSYSIIDSNILGFGKELKLSRSKNTIRTQRMISYFDPFLASNRTQLKIEHSDNSDGTLDRMFIGRPFYSFRSKWSYALNMSNISKIGTLYQNGQSISTYEDISKNASVSVGISNGLVNNETRRWRWGFSYSKKTFQPDKDSALDLDIRPKNRTLSYPFLELESIENKYIKTKRFSYINRVEDVNLGRSYSVQLGWADAVYGSTINGIIYKGFYENSFKRNESESLFYSLKLGGRINNVRPNFKLESVNQYFKKATPNHIIYTSLKIQIGKNLDLDSQIFLGGATGLRGYPSRYLNGDAVALLNIEHRIYTNIHLFNMFYVGGVAFLDIGRGWPDNNLPNSRSGRFLKDVGVGLRITSSRAGKGKVLHIDLAYPLDGDSSINRSQLTITTKQAF